MRIRSEKVTRYGYTFRSKAEAAFADTLEARLRSAKIAGWTYEPFFYTLTVNGTKVAKYLPDFLIDHNDGSDEIVEVKGYWTDAARLKIKLFNALHPEIKFSIIGTPLDKRRKKRG